MELRFWIKGGAKGWVSALGGAAGQGVISALGCAQLGETEEERWKRGGGGPRGARIAGGGREGWRPHKG